MAHWLAEKVENERCGGDSDASEHVGERPLLQPPLVHGRAVLFGSFRLIGSQGVRPDHQFRQFQDILRRHLGVVIVEKDILREDIDPRLANRRQVLQPLPDFGDVGGKVAQCAAANPHSSRKGMDNFAMQKRLPFAPEHYQQSSHAATIAGRPAARPCPTRQA